MSFWRKEVIDFALDHETALHVEEQRALLAREPGNPRPYHNLAQLFRIQGRQDDALGLLLEAVRLDDSYADAHIALAEIYIVRNDEAAAWHHARSAEAAGNPRAVELLARHSVPENGVPENGVPEKGVPEKGVPEKVKSRKSKVKSQK